MEKKNAEIICGDSSLFLHKPVNNINSSWNLYKASHSVKVYSIFVLKLFKNDSTVRYN